MDFYSKFTVSELNKLLTQLNVSGRSSATTKEEKIQLLKKSSCAPNTTKKLSSRRTPSSSSSPSPRTPTPSPPPKPRTPTPSPPPKPRTPTPSPSPKPTTPTPSKSSEGSISKLLSISPNPVPSEENTMILNNFIKENKIKIKPGDFNNNKSLDEIIDLILNRDYLLRDEMWRKDAFMHRILQLVIYYDKEFKHFDRSSILDTIGKYLFEQIKLLPVNEKLDFVVELAKESKLKRK